METNQSVRHRFMVEVQVHFCRTVVIETDTEEHARELATLQVEPTLQDGQQITKTLTTNVTQISGPWVRVLHRRHIFTERDIFTIMPPEGAEFSDLGVQYIKYLVEDHFANEWQVREYLTNFEPHLSITTRTVGMPAKEILRVMKILQEPPKDWRALCKTIV